MDKRQNIKLPPDVHFSLVNLAKKEGRTITAQIKKLIVFYEKVAPQLEEIDNRITKLEKALKKV